MAKFKVGDRARISTDPVIMAKMGYDVVWSGLEGEIVEENATDSRYAGKNYYLLKLDKVPSSFAGRVAQNTLHVHHDAMEAIPRYDEDEFLKTKAFTAIKSLMKKSEVRSDEHTRACDAYQRWGYLKKKELTHWASL